MKNSLFFSAALLLMLIHACAPSQQAGMSKNILVQHLIDSQRYVFTAQSVQPMGTRTRQLSGGYTLQVTPDTITSSLPYFGRAYSAPIDPAQGGINFTSTKFDYEVSSNAKDAWDVVIHPKDAPGYQQLRLVIFSNGTASLKVMSNNRQPISFNGFIDRRGN